MVQVVAVGRNKAPSFLYNIDAHVGAGRANQLDDVEFVRLGYYSLLRNPRAGTIAPEFRAALTLLKPSGGFGADLDAVIRAHQRSRGGTQDGAVSPLPAGTAWNGRYDGSHRWIVEMLQANLHDLAGAKYPRIDALEGCGSTLKARIQQIFTIPS